MAGTERSLTFTPPGVDLKEELEKVAGESGVIDPQILEREFRRLFAQVHQANGQWAENRFRTLRTGMHDWSLDGMLVNGNGRIILGPWSTFRMYLTNKVTDLTLTVLLSEMQKKEELLFPLTPKKDSAIFWLEENTEHISAAILEHLPYSLEVEDYGEFSSTDFGFRRIADLRKIRIARLESGKVGDGKFAQKDVVRGRLGFWEHSSPEGPTYTPRVSIARSRIIPKQIYISPTPESEVLVKGGIPMDENHPNLRVLRTNPDLTQKDFIIAALLKFSQEYPDVPFVVSFDTYRPWLDSYPHHGS